MEKEQTQKPKTPQEIQDMLIGIGKDIALRMVGDAVKSAEDEAQLRNQLFIGQVAACHMLAHFAFNREVSGKMTAEQWLDLTVAEIKKDVAGFREAHASGELELVIPKYEQN